MDRYWLLTSTFYGNWLPGDRRGFVSRVRDVRPEDAVAGSRFQHDLPGTPYDQDIVGLQRSAHESMRGPRILINGPQAQTLLAQFIETAAYRGWELRAVALMDNHMHIVAGVPGDPEPTKILGDFKAWGSRALNQRWGKPRSGTWWTYDGSKRKLAGDQALVNAIDYLRRQLYPLLIWIDGSLVFPASGVALAPRVSNA